MGAPVAPNSLNQSPVTRLQLCQREAARGALDGAWWPNTTDLQTELPDLIAVLGRVIGLVRRVVYDPSGWSPAPRRIIRGGTATPVDPYRLVSADTIYLIGTHSREAVLFVIPPASAKPAAYRVLSAVADAMRPVNVVALRDCLLRARPISEEPQLQGR
jgi:hypothetical protein